MVMRKRAEWQGENGKVWEGVLDTQKIDNSGLGFYKRMVYAGFVTLSRDARALSCTRAYFPEGHAEATTRCDGVRKEIQPVANTKGLNMKKGIFCFLGYVCVTAAASAGIFQGLNNTALGSATVYITNIPSSGQDGSALYITNLGSGGQDGVGITLPAEATGLSVVWQALDASNTLPTGAYIEEQAIGTANGIAGSVLGAVTVTKTGTGDYSISANYSGEGASSYTAQAYLRGVLVGQAVGLSGTSLAQAGAMPGGDDVGDIITPLSQEWPGGGATVTIGTTLQVKCDHLIITPENAISAGNATSLQITTSGISSVTVTAENESLSYQGLSNTSLGQASVVTECCVSNLSSGGQDGLALYVSNLSSGGQDGVTISLPTNLTALSVNWAPLDLSNTLPTGAAIIERAVGTANGIAQSVLGAVIVTKAGTSNYTISANYSPLGASNYTAQAYLQGVLVAQATGLGGSSLAQANLMPGGDDVGDIITPLSQEWPNGPATVTIGASAHIFCDHLIITPENVPSPGNPTALDITMTGIPDFIVIGENESQTFQGLTNTSLSSASVTTDCCVSNLGSGGQDGLTLYITNLGSSGQDGVSFTMPANLSGMEVFWEDLDDSNTLPTGAFIQEQLVGTANGITNGVLGTVTMTKAGTTNYSILPDFTPLGAEVYLLAAYSNGTQVAATTTGPRPALAHPRGIAISSGFSTNGSTNSTWEWTMGWGTNPISFTMPGGPTVTCDHLVFAPENVALSGTPAALQLVGYEIPSMTMTAATVSPLVIRGQNGPDLLTLQWYGPGVLQQSTNLGTWVTLTNSTSPSVVPIVSNNQSYYRVWQVPVN
jgi:hypothetical protein